MHIICICCLLGISFTVLVSSSSRLRTQSKFGHKLRALSLSSSLLISCSLLTCTSAFLNPAFAQIPSMDDFYITSGTKVRDVGAKVPSNVDLAPPVFDLNQITSEKSSGRIKDMKALIDSARWDDLRASIAYYKPLNKDFFGSSSVREMADALSVDRKKGELLEGLRAEASFALKQLDDVALSSRTLFFNKEDLKQVENMYLDETSRKKEKENIAEALDTYTAVVVAFDKLYAEL